mmetsp:Transcript_22120/g.57715  ORF Transcript_22120/g.57715 Transcript_22120/m.57715 type:complete len:107 (+) Transcript_22120:813-1133(+)
MSALQMSMASATCLLRLISRSRAFLSNGRELVGVDASAGGAPRGVATGAGAAAAAVPGARGVDGGARCDAAVADDLVGTAPLGAAQDVLWLGTLDGTERVGGDWGA